MSSFFDWLSWNLGEILIDSVLLAALAALATIGVVVYADVTSEKITLTKSQWTCAKKVTQWTYMTQIVGGQTILVPMPYDDCVRYVKAGHAE